MTAYALNVRFCEPKYAQTPYVAEFYNTISNAAYVIAGLYGLYHSPRTFSGKLSHIILILIGLGSATMHATLQYWAELLDEGPMLCLIVLYQISWSKLLAPTYARSFAWFLIAANLILFGLYVIFHDYDIFVQSFTVQVVAVCLSPLIVLWTSLGSQRVRGLVQANRTRVFSIVTNILVARIGWELEQQLTNSISFGNWRGAADPALCAKWPELAWCHVWWHVQSAYVAYGTTTLLDSVTANSKEQHDD